MMAKLGKYSTGLKGSVPMSKHSSGGGHANRASLMAELHKLEPRQKPKDTYAGAAGDPLKHRPKQ